MQSLLKLALEFARPHGFTTLDTILLRALPIITLGPVAVPRRSACGLTREAYLLEIAELG